MPRCSCTPCIFFHLFIIDSTKVVTVEHIYDHLYIECLHFQLTKGVQKSVNSDTRGQNVKIYSKLSTVMGVTWLLGFGAAHSTIVAYLYIIINSLQGKKLSKTILKLDVVMPFINLSLCVKFCIWIKTHFCIHCLLLVQNLHLCKMLLAGLLVLWKNHVNLLLQSFRSGRKLGTSYIQC